MGTNIPEQLIKKVSDGDKEAFSQLCAEKYSSAVYQANAILRNYHDAEEVVQNTMIKLYKSIGTLKDAGSFNAWFQKLIANECINFIRLNQKRSRDLQYFEESDMREEEEISWLPVEMIENNEYQEIFSILIDRLSPQVKRSIVLYYYEDLSYKDIGEIMNISQSTVGTNIARGKDYLKKAMMQIPNIEIVFEDEQKEKEPQDG